MKLRRQDPQQPPAPHQPGWSGVVAYQISNVFEGQAELVATLIADQDGQTYVRADSLADRNSLLLVGRVEGIVAAWCAYTGQTFPGNGSELVRQLSMNSLAITDTVEVGNCSIEETRSLTFDELRTMSEGQLDLKRGGLEGW